MRKKVKIDFCNFWPGFKKEDNYFINLLRTKYDVEISSSPDYLIFSSFGIKKDHKKYKCIKIFYTGENRRPYDYECDYSFSFDYLDDPDHYRLPLYALYGDYEDMIRQHKEKKVDEIIKSKKKFCAFVYSNGDAYQRNKFFHKLSRYKQVDSGGGHLNNIGRKVSNKLEFISNYKFMIAYENSSYAGYTTEKIYEPMTVNTIPIYWGNPLVHRDFNTKSFINYYDYEDEEAMIEQIIKIDNDDDLYRKMLEESFFLNNEPNKYIQKEAVLKQFDYIFTNNREPIALKNKKKKLFTWF